MGTNRSAMVIEDNLKKALAELLVLALLHHRDYYALELSTALTKYSGGAIHLTFPYAILYRMIDQGYIQELPRRKADGRKAFKWSFRYRNENMGGKRTVKKGA